MSEHLAIHVDEDSEDGLSELEVVTIIDALRRDFLWLREQRGLTVADKRRMRKLRSSIIAKLEKCI